MAQESTRSLSWVDVNKACWDELYPSYGKGFVAGLLPVALGMVVASRMSPNFARYCPRNIQLMLALMSATATAVANGEAEVTFCRRRLERRKRILEQQVKEQGMVPS